MFYYRFEDGKIPIVFFKNNTNFVDMQILFKTGSANEDLDSYGIAHFLEHMHFQGTNKRTKKQLAVEMGTYGQFNAETYYFHTSYYFNCVKDNFLKCFDLLTDAVFGSTFPEEELEKEKQVVTEEFDMYQNDQDEVFAEFVFNDLFSSEMHSIIGSHESIKSFNREKLLRYRCKFYNNKNCYIIVAGDLNFEDVIKLVDDNIDPLPKSYFTNASFVRKEQNKNYFINDDFDQSSIAIITPWILPKNDKNKTLFYFSKCLNQVFYDILRDDMGLCYGIAQSNIGDHISNNAFFTMLTNASKLNQASYGFSSVFEKIKKEGFKKEVLNLAENQYLHSRATVLDNSSSASSSILNRIVSSTTNEDIKSLNLDIHPVDNDKLIDFANEYLNDFIEYRMVRTNE